METTSKKPFFRQGAMLHVFFLIILGFLVISCEELTDWEQEGEFIPQLVVEGFITSSSISNYIRLSLPVTTPDQPSRKVSGATVAITDGTYVELFAESPDEKGLYLPLTGKTGEPYKGYRLYVEIDGNEFIADAFMVPVSPMNEFSYSEVNGNPGYYRIHPDNSQGPFMLKYIVRSRENSSTSMKESVFYQYSLSTVDVNQFFKPGSEDLVFPRNSLVIRTKYSLSPAYEQYLRSLLSETEWKGGWFDVLPGNLDTNLSSGGAGFFAACAVVSDTVSFR